MPRVLALSAVLLLAACGGGESATGTAERPASSSCDQAFQAAAAVSDAQDTQADLQPAFSACASMQEFAAAHERHPGAIDAQIDPTEYARNQCLYEPTVKDTPVCRSLPAG